MQSQFKNLNTRLMVIHFITFLIFIYAFQSLGFVHDYKFLFAASERVNRLNFPARFYDDITFIEQIGNFGLLVAYIISWSISSKKGWHWINSVIIFLLAFVFKNFIVANWPKFHDAIVSPGGILKIYSLWGHLLEGLVLVALGLCIFYSKKVISFIDPAKPANVNNSNKAGKKQ